MARRPGLLQSAKFAKEWTELNTIRGQEIKQDGTDKETDAEREGQAKGPGSVRSRVLKNWQPSPSVGLLSPELLGQSQV